MAFSSPLLAATYTVTACASSGAGSLRQAILDANSNAGKDTINFNISFSEATWETSDVKWYKIKPGTSLPTITGPVTINGATQPTDETHNNPYGPEIEIDGTGMASSSNCFYITTNECEIKDLVINRCSTNTQYAILIIGGNNTVSGCYLGTTITGDAPAINYCDIGILGKENTIGSTESAGRNILSGATQYGVGLFSSGTNNNRVIGNYIGLNRSGNSAAVGNGTYGVYVASPADDNWIGGVNPGEGNVISCNGTGILAYANGTKIMGNYIGTGPDGNSRMGNSTGVYIYNGADNNMIGSTESGGRNIISGNQVGIVLDGSGTNNNKIIGNYIGLNAGGDSTAEGNSMYGINLNSTAYNQIGDGTAAGRNIISANQLRGIYAFSSSNNDIFGNYIGTDPSGNIALGNGKGFYFASPSCANNRIGNSTPNGGNLISGNLGDGIHFISCGSGNEIVGNNIGTDAGGVLPLSNQGWGINCEATSSTKIGPSNSIAFNNNGGVSVSGSALYNRITQNSIFDNNSLGIQLSGGGNSGIAAPLISAAIYSSGTTEVTGSAPANASVEVFTTGIPDPFGSGEGRTYLASTDANGSGNWSIDIAGLTIGSTLTATATDTNKNTSMFSLNRHVADMFTVTNCLDTGGGSLRQVITNANANAGIDTITFNIPNTDPGYTTEAGATFWRIQPASNLPTITETVIIDGSTQTANQGNTNTYGPEIMLDGANVSVGPPKGLYITTDECVVKSLIINYFRSSGYGILIEAANSNRIYGCYIGTDATGANSVNNYIGIGMASHSQSNIIGSTESANINIISGNAGSGVYISASDTNEVIGNYIGLTATGEAVLVGNSQGGINIYNGSSYNKVGNGTDSGRNIISGNPYFGVDINGTDNYPTGNIVSGNYIGTNKGGTVAFGNGNSGIRIRNGGQANIVGGVAAEAGNVISGNDIGVLLADATNEVLGNYIGTNASGTAALGNTSYGIEINAGAKNNKIGSTESGGRNIISGNSTGYGIYITDSGTSSNEVLGNYIGTSSDGNSPLANNWGVFIDGTAQYNQIGSTESGGRNIISGNTTDGVYLSGSGTNYNKIIGNYIGLNPGGNAANEGNGRYGIMVRSSAYYNQIGDGTAAGRNIISANNTLNGVGIAIWTNSTEVSGNYVGTDPTGNISLGNTSGIFLTGGAKYNRISGNLVSGNTGNSGCGIGFASAGTNSNEVVGNFIGTNAAGNGYLSNNGDGIYFYNGPQFNRIGGIATGEGNVISGNKKNGIYMESSTTGSNEVIGNYIGTGTSGAGVIGNDNCGIYLVSGASNNIIGPNNVIANNGTVYGYGGIYISGTNTVFNRITLNSIFDNRFLGISLWSGGNSSVAAPAISSALYNSGSGLTTVTGTATTDATVEVFSTGAPDTAGSGEGRVYLVSTREAGGAWSIDLAGLTIGSTLTATATDINNNTSMFSVNKISSLPLSITEISPATGESWQAGSWHNITWESSGTPESINLYYSINNGSSYTLITTNETDDGAYPWLVTGTATTAAKVKLEAVKGAELATSESGAFTITGAADYYVDAVNGNNSYNGLTAEVGTYPNGPWKTITYAAATSATFSTIHAATGTYDTALGETFPIDLGSNRKLIGYGGIATLENSSSRTITIGSFSTLETISVMNSNASAYAVLANGIYASILNCTIETSSTAGCVQLSGSHESIVNSTIRAPGTNYNGVYVTGTFSTVQGNNISGNFLSGISAAAVYYTADNCLLLNNNIAASNSIGQAVYFDSFVTDNITVEGNTVSPYLYCCGLRFKPGYTHKVYISGNYLNGGGIAMDLQASEGTVAFNEIRNFGEGIDVYSNSGQLTIDHNTIVKTRIGIDGLVGAAVNITNNIISSSPEGGSIVNSKGIYVYGAGSVSSTYNCIFGNQYNYTGVTAGTGDISRYPRFTNSAGNDYTLAYNSPCIDSGDPAYPSDPDGSRTDMGMHPFNQTLSANPTVYVKSPISGEALTGTTTYEITWYATHDGTAIDHIDLYYSTNEGSTYPYAIATNEVNDGAYPWTVINIATSEGRVRAVAVGSVGTAESDSNFTVNYYETIPPLVTVEAPNGGEQWQGGSIKNISFSATDESGINPNSLSIWYSTDGGSSYPNSITADDVVISPYAWTLPDDVSTNEVKIRLSVKDNSINQNLGTDESDASFTIDSTPPSTPEAIYPLSGTITNDATPSFSWNAAMDNLTGIASYEIDLDGTLITQDATTSYTPAVSLEAGIHSWGVKARDGVGNWGIYSSIETFTVDTGVPVVGGIILRDVNTGNSSYSGQRLISVEASGVTGDPVKMKLSEASDFAGASWIDYLANTEFQLSTPEGAKTAFYKVMDIASNESSTKSAGIVLDLSEPSIPTLVYPANDSAVSNTQPAFSWEAAVDALSGIASYEIKIDSAVITRDASVIYTPSVPLTETSHSWEVRAKNGAGLWGGFSSLFTFSIKTGTPEVNSIILRDKYTGSNLYTRNNVVSVEARDVTGGPVSMVLSEDSGFSGGSWIDYLVRTEFEISSAEGTKRVYYKLKDLASNESSPVSATIIYDATEPSIPTPESPVEGDVLTSLNPTFSWQPAIDSLSGIASYEIKIDEISTTTGTTPAYTPETPLVIGAHSWEVRAKDRAENWGGFSSTQTFSVVTTTVTSTSTTTTTTTTGTTTTTIITALVKANEQLLKNNVTNNLPAASNITGSLLLNGRAVASRVRVDLVDGASVNNVYTSVGAVESFSCSLPEITSGKNYILRFTFEHGYGSALIFEAPVKRQEESITSFTIQTTPLRGATLNIDFVAKEKATYDVIVYYVPTGVTLPADPCEATPGFNSYKWKGAGSADAGQYLIEFRNSETHEVVIWKYFFVARH